MENFLTWRDSWLTGIEVLDVQHAELVSCLNSIAGICFGKQDQDSETCCMQAEQLEKLAAQLYEKTRQHFRYEEQLMLEAGYPDYPAHVNEHGMLLAELKLVIRTRIREGKENIDTETLEALKSWFIAHVIHSDKLFAQFAAKQRIFDTCTGDQQ